MNTEMDQPVDDDDDIEDQEDDYDDDGDEDEDEEDFEVDQDDGEEPEKVISGGFSAPDENDDPFRTQSLTTSVGNFENENQEPDPSPGTLYPPPISTPENNDKVVKIKSSARTQESHKKKKQKIASKGQPFRVLKAPRPQSNGSEDFIDVEEERLKMLPDCCEFTRRNEAFEIDEGRKEMSSAWFSQVKLTPAQQKQLCFAESLLLVEETGNIVGKYYCTISNSKWNDKSCLCVHAGSFGKFSTGLESGTSITSFINYNMKPLQEFVHEWASINSNAIERKTLVMKEMDAMPCKITLLRNGQIVDTKQLNLGIKEQENLITEGINLLLQRLLILERRTTASMIVQSISYTGKVVRAKYGELGSGWENVKGKQMKTWGIRRTVYVSDEEERIWDSLYNKNARLILRCQPESPQALIPLWYESIIDFDKNGNFIGSYCPYAWACDVELYSKYSVRKEEITHEHRRYILDHPEVRALLSDYLQAILFRKPPNVIEFTKHYFESFLNLKGKPTKSQAKKASDSSRSSSFYLDGSSLSLLGESGMGEGEWLGEGEDGDATSFYPVNPTVNYDGLEQVDEDPNIYADEPSEMLTTENDETEDDLVVNEEGQYVPGSSRDGI